MKSLEGVPSSCLIPAYVGPIPNFIIYLFKKENFGNNHPSFGMTVTKNMLSFFLFLGILVLTLGHIRFGAKGNSNYNKGGID